jgi:hypothetical protein
LLVVPEKFLIVMSEMVSLAGNYCVSSLVLLEERKGAGSTDLVAECEVLLPVALGDFDSVVNVVENHAVVGDVLDSTGTTSALKVTGKSGRSTRPDLDARTVGSIRHANIVHIDVLNDIDFAGILPQATNTDTMTAVADKILHDDIRAIRLERNAVVAVVDVRLLNDDVIGAISIPAISVLSGVLAHTATSNVDIGEQNIAGVGNECVPLRAVSELQILNRGTLRADEAEENGPEDVDVLGVEVIPCLAVPVQSTASVDVDVLATELEEGGGVLKDLLEGVGLPVVGVISEQDVSLNIYTVLAIKYDNMEMSLPRSMCFRNVRSSAVPIVKSWPLGKTT